jgi:hypothetical protein
MSDQPTPPPPLDRPTTGPWVEIGDSELEQMLTFAARQNRALFSERRRIEWWGDTRPEILAKAQVEQLRMAGVRVWRPPAARGGAAHLYVPPPRYEPPVRTDAAASTSQGRKPPDRR